MSKSKTKTTDKPTEKKQKKVAIIGFAPHRVLAPYMDESFEIWGLNDLYEHLPRWTRWFDVHDRVIYKLDETYVTRKDGKPHVQRLKELNCPVYMAKQYEDIPNSVRFPIEEAVEYFKTRYFTNTISMMIALAVMEEFEVIHVYGVDMAVGTEYENQRSSCEYFLGFARGKGIEVYMPPESDLLQTAFIYGFEDEQRSAYEAKLDAIIKGMEERKTHADNVIAHQTAVSNQYLGAISAAKDIKRVRII